MHGNSQDYVQLHDAFAHGDLEALRKLLGNPEDFPNTTLPQAACIGEDCLGYAIYHSPLPFIQTLLELGANPNFPAQDGFPSLIAAITSDRADKHTLVKMLLSFGADIQQRGINDYTPLHQAAACDDVEMIQILFEHGADLSARTRIDHYSTPLEEAVLFGHQKAVEALKGLMLD